MTVTFGNATERGIMQHIRIEREKKATAAKTAMYMNGAKHFWDNLTLDQKANYANDFNLWFNNNFEQFGYGDIK